MASKAFSIHYSLTTTHFLVKDKPTFDQLRNTLARQRLNREIFTLTPQGGWYTGAMQPVWERLTQPFSADAVTWRVLEVAEAETPGGAARARVRPQLSYEAALERLNETVQPSGWSNRYVVLGNDAISCELRVEGVTKAAVALFTEQFGADETAHDAFVYAAELFGMVPPVDTEPVYWVDYDPEAKTILHEPAAEVEAAPEVLTPAQHPQTRWTAGD